MRKKIIGVFLVCIIMVLVFCIVYQGGKNKYSRKLIEAIRNNDISLVEEIVREHPDCINVLPSNAPSGWNSAMNLSVLYPLTEACVASNSDIVKLLIEHGADTNCNNGFTPLSVTYSGKKDGWYEISLLLIENGASLNYTTDYSGKELSVFQDIVQVRPGANGEGYIPESSNEVNAAFYYALVNCDQSQVNWMRVLQHSITNDRIEIVKLLLDEGYCDVNDTSAGMTALMFAVRDSNAEMVQLLLDYGADKDYVDSVGKTVLDYAVESNNKEVISILKK